MDDIDHSILELSKLEPRSAKFVAIEMGDEDGIAAMPLGERIADGFAELEKSEKRYVIGVGLSSVLCLGADLFTSVPIILRVFGKISTETLLTYSIPSSATSLLSLVPLAYYGIKHYYTIEKLNKIKARVQPILEVTRDVKKVHERLQEVSKLGTIDDSSVREDLATIEQLPTRIADLRRNNPRHTLYGIVAREAAFKQKKIKESLEESGFEDITISFGGGR